MTYNLYQEKFPVMREHAHGADSVHSCDKLGVLEILFADWLMDPGRLDSGSPTN